MQSIAERVFVHFKQESPANLPRLARSDRATQLTQYATQVFPLQRDEFMTCVTEKGIQATVDIEYPPLGGVILSPVTDADVTKLRGCPQVETIITRIDSPLNIYLP